MRRVVVTGMGIVSSLGCGMQTAFNRLKKYENTVKYMEELEEYRGLNCRLAAPVCDLVIPDRYTRKVMRTMGPVSLMAAIATDEAIEMAGLSESKEITDGRCGVAYGSSYGSVKPILDFHSMIREHEIRQITSSTYIKMMPHTCAVNLSIHLKTKGRLIPTGTACTSGSLAIGSAYETIKYGIQDIMIAGGAEELDVSQIAVFDALYATSVKNDAPDKTPRPFDKDRDGLVIGEGAATLILEEMEHAKARGAKIIAEVVGFSENTDGAHATQPSQDTMAACMREALVSAQIPASEIGYINAHGTSTKQGDIAESMATAAVFGNEIPISTLKSYTGHSLGACGSMEASLAIMMMNNDWYAPNINLVTPDPDCAALNYMVNCGCEFGSEYIISNNFAFGGINTSLIFRRI